MNDDAYLDSLARFRADPRKVHVCLRPDRGGWSCRIVISDIAHVCVWDRSGVRAVCRALGTAWKNELPGVDLGMGSSYPHPFGKRHPSAMAIDHQRGWLDDDVGMAAFQ